MADDNGGGKRPIPYVSFSTYETFISDMHQHGVPSRVDRSVLKRFSGGVATQLLTSLRALGLLANENEPTRRLHSQVNAYGSDEWAGAVKEMAADVFAPLIEIDLLSATPAQFNERMRSSFVGGDDNQRKAASFFFNAARVADIPIGPRILSNRRASPGVNRRKPSSSSKKQAKPPIPTGTPNQNSDTQRTNESTSQTRPLSHILVDMLSMTDMTDDEQMAVWTLVRYQKRKEAEQSQPK